MSLKEKVLAFLREEEGLTTVEYAVAGTVLVLAIAAAFTLLGTEIQAGIEWIGDQIQPG